MSDQQKRKGTYHAIATIDARTERGGYVTDATSGLVIRNLRAARVGDIVTDGDGSQAVVIDGAGVLGIDCAKPYAVVGSSLSNGDKITSTPWDDGKSSCFVEEGKTHRGLFDSAFVPAPHEPGCFALGGSTTRRGGVLREPRREWNVDGRRTNVGVIGDVVHYADGTTARIVTGLALTANRALAQFAYVGSVLDNGDIITDSPERNGSAWPGTWGIVAEEQLKRGEAA